MRISMLRNRELMRVFKDVELVEALGSGMRRILAAYDRSVFEITPSFIVVTFPYAEDFDRSMDESDPNHDPNDDPNDPNDLIKLIERDGKITYAAIAQELGISSATVKRRLQELKEAGYIQRVGETRGRWEVKQADR